MSRPSSANRPKKRKAANQKTNAGPEQPIRPSKRMKKLAIALAAQIEQHEEEQKDITLVRGTKSFDFREDDILGITPQQAQDGSMFFGYVTPGSQADRAGIISGDVPLVNGNPIGYSVDVMRRPPGPPVPKSIRDDLMPPPGPPVPKSIRIIRTHKKLHNIHKRTFKIK